MPSDLRRPPNSENSQNLAIRDPLPDWNIGRLNDIYFPWGGNPQQGLDPRFVLTWPDKTQSQNPGLQDPGIHKSDDWNFPIDITKTNQFFFYPSIGMLGRIHRGTPWQTIYLKSPYLGYDVKTNPVPLIDPNNWIQWSGSLGTIPIRDYSLLDVFTVAPNEAAVRGLLSVNQTNRAAWSAVLSGITVWTNSVRTTDLATLGPDEGLNPTNAFTVSYVEPGSPQISNIVSSINSFRLTQREIGNATPPVAVGKPLGFVPKLNVVNNLPYDVFDHVGDVLSAPGLSVSSPFLNPHALQIQHVWTDEAVERIPQQILSLLQRDEPRFVVYAFGQALKPAPHSLVTSANFYNLCTNYQITGEVITKTTFHVEGELKNPNNPLRAVVETYDVLPPSE